jgi:hypothetical protein
VARIQRQRGVEVGERAGHALPRQAIHEVDVDALEAAG